MNYWKESIIFIFRRPLILILIFIGAAVQLAIIFPNGDISCKNNICGMWFNGRYIHDSLWHIALARTGFNQFPFINPNYDGAILQGYNFLLDFIMYLFSFIGISPFFSFYKFLPIVFSIIFPLAIIRFGLILKKHPTYIYLLLFFCYFGSAFGYILSLYNFGSLYESSLWRFPVSQTLQSGTMLYNLQFAYSILILLILFPYLYKKSTTKGIIIAAVGIFFACGFKFFGGLTLLSIFGLKEVIEFIMYRKQFKKTILRCFIYLITFIISIFVFYNPFSSTKSGSIFILAPFATAHSMIEEKEMFYSRTLTDARYYLYAVGGFSPRLLFIEIYSSLLLIIFNFSTRLIGIGLLFVKKIKENTNPVNLSINITIIFSIIFTIFFIQKGDWFNTMQFLFYGVFLANFAVAEYLSILFQKKSIITYAIIGAVIILTIPSNLDALRYWYDKPSYISSYELEALKKLESAPNGVILTLSHKNSSYISAFSGKNMYVADSQQLYITGIEYKKRLIEIETISPQDIHAMQIDYIYLHKSNKRDSTFIKYMKSHDGYQLFFENKEIIVINNYSK